MAALRPRITVSLLACLTLFFASSAFADFTVRRYRNCGDAGYPFIAITDDEMAELSVQIGARTNLPQGTYYAGIYTFYEDHQGPLCTQIPYTVDACGVVNSSSTVNIGLGYSEAEWDSFAAGQAPPARYTFKYLYTDENGNPAAQTLTSLTRGDQPVIGPPDWSAAISLLSSVVHKREHHEVVPHPTKCHCSCQTGAGSAAVNSVDYSVNLGQSSFGNAQDTLGIHSGFIDASLYTPYTLTTEVDDPSSVVLYSNSVPRQVLCSQSLVDVQVVNTYTYQINFYHRLGGDPLGSDGFYQCGGAPFRTITVANPDASTTITNRLRITESGDGLPTKATEYDWTAGQQRWDLFTGNGLRNEVLSTVIDPATSDKIETRSVVSQGGQTVTKKVQRFHMYSVADEMISETLDPDGAALTSTWAYYDAADTTPGAYQGMLKQKVDASGRWEAYQYTSSGQEAKHVTSFLDAPLGSPDNACRVVTTTYAATNPIATTVETLQGVEIGRRYRAATTDGQRQDIVCQQPGAAWDAPGNLVTTSRIDAAGQTLREQRPDGTLTIGSYVTANGQKTSTVSVGAPSADGSTVVDGTTTTTVIDVNGNQLVQTVTDIASGLTLSSATAVQTDNFGRPVKIVHADGSFELTDYGCCGVDSRTDRDGNTTSYAYDVLARQVSQTQAGITTLYTYDADGRRLTTTRQGSDGSRTATEQVAYDLAGRQASRTDALGRVTTFAEAIDPASGHLASTTTLPDDAHSTRVETYAQDGSLLSLGGTGAHPLSYAYGADAAAGAWTQQTRLGSQGETSEWTKTYTDAAGRQYKTQTAAGAVSLSTFNAQGQLASSVDPDGVTMLYGYNARGKQDTTAIDLDRNGQIDFAGTDRINRTTRAVVSAHGTVVSRTTTSAWTTPGADSPAVMSVDDQGVDGRSSWHTDAAGLASSSVTSCDGAGTCTTTLTAPDGSYSVSVSQAGRVTAQTRYDAASQALSATTLDYDAQGRLWHQNDLRDGATTYTFDAADQVRRVSHAGQTTSYDFDGLGRKTLETQPDGGQVQTLYWPTGEVKSVGGARTYPQSYSYDAQGRLQTLTTQGAAGAEVTTWSYDAASGQMVGKVYADGKGPTYTYTPGGRLLTRTWARGIVTTYGYDNAGQLQSITYSDGFTPSASYSFDRLGRLLTASGGGSARSLAYQGNTNLLASETATAGPLTGVSVSTGYDGLLRRAGLQVSQGQTNLFSQSFGFDAASRLASAAQGTASAAYTYWPSSASNLVHTITFSNSAQPVMTTTKTYDVLNRLTSIASQLTGATTPVSGFGYTYNAANERTRIDVAADGSHWLDGYDSLGQVTSASRQWSDNSPVGGQQFSYAYDQIGNRTSTTTNGRQSAYTSNLLNQYSQRTVPGAVDVIGVAAPDAAVTLDNQPTQRQSGGYFFGTAAASNSQAAVDVPVSVVAVKIGTGSGGSNAFGTQTGSVFVPQTPEQFGYDADGNLAHDGRWTYTWDGENRLIGMEALGSLPVGDRKKLSFGYDDTGRRVQKQVGTWNANGSGYQAATNTLFVYDGWSLVAELDGANSGALQRSYLWGSDLSGSLQGAGGVGGLLLLNAHTQGANPQTHFASCDANGNITMLVNAANRGTSAIYEYSPFGQEDRVSGQLIAKNNPIRWSTKYTDQESGIIYYGHRYYNASVGSWISKDPLSETGSINLYNWCQNNALSFVDNTGLQMMLEVPSILEPVATQSAGKFIGPGVGVDGPPPLAPSTNPVFQPQAPIMLAPPYTYANPAPNSSKTRQPCNECRYRWILPKGGYAKHDSYAARFNGGVSADMLVTTPEGLSVAYDAASPGPYNKPPYAVYEVKTGYEWLFARYPNYAAIFSLSAQFATEEFVAERCNLYFSVFVDNKTGADALAGLFPEIPIGYVP